MMPLDGCLRHVSLSSTFDFGFTLSLSLLFYLPLLNSTIMTQLEKVSSNRVSTGTLTKYKFASTSLSLPTQLNLFVPSGASSSSPVPVLFYLAGLTCTEDTGCQKGGFLNKAGDEGIAVIFPDTSPRGAGVEGEDDDWQLGTGKRFRCGAAGIDASSGAGFYLNANEEKWKKHYNMYDLIVEEIPSVLKEANLGLVSFVSISGTFDSDRSQDLSRVSIMGHSMGGKLPFMADKV